MKLGRLALRSALALVALAAVLVPAGGGALASSQAGTMTGTWKLTATIHGTTDSVTLKLVQKGTAITGIVNAHGTVMKVTGSIVQQKLALHFQYDKKPFHAVYLVTAMVNGAFDAFSGTLYVTETYKGTTKHLHGPATGKRTK